ncbi:MAG: hypothetical protein AAB339_07915, partial [Elusimicrobiota bacterium]
VRALIEGRRVVLIDDSIVRGTTSRKIVAMMRQAGAKEVHMRISSPPTIGPCYYGIDTPGEKELIASTKDVEGIRNFIEADTLKYLSLPGLQGAVKDSQGEFCSACFTLRYPVAVTDDEISQMKLFEREEQWSPSETAPRIRMVPTVRELSSVVMARAGTRP